MRWCEKKGFHLALYEGIEAEKAALRRQLFQAQRELEPAILRQSDAMLFHRLCGMPEFRKASCVFLYVGTGGEPDTKTLIPGLLMAGKRVAVPLCFDGGEMEARVIESAEDLKPGRFGILEPEADTPALSPETPDFILVPALCYDRGGFRLGRGGGYYDRYLAKSGAFSAGLCRERFLQEALCRTAHDRRVDVVVTEKEIIRPGPGAWEPGCA